MDLIHLFDIEWHSKPGLEPVVSDDDREGALIGSGEGTVTGPKLEGTLRFSFYTAECLFDPGFVVSAGLDLEQLGNHACRINPGGVIATADGARIQFDVKGFGLRREATAPKWTLTGGVRLVTDDERYRWLNDVLGLWEGEFDEETSTARYHVHARGDALQAAGLVVGGVKERAA